MLFLSVWSFFPRAAWLKQLLNLGAPPLTSVVWPLPPMLRAHHCLHLQYSLKLCVSQETNLLGAVRVPNVATCCDPCDVVNVL